MLFVLVRTLRLARLERHPCPGAPAEKAKKDLKEYFRDLSADKREYADKYLDDAYYTRSFRSMRSTHHGRNLQKSSTTGVSFINRWIIH